MWLIKMIDHFEEEQVLRDWNHLIQGKTEPVMKFFGRYEKALATYKLYEGLQEIPYLTVRTAEEGCAQWHLLCR
jgi:hypothetical protein